MFEKVLVPTDFSTNSRRVLECVAYCPGIKEAVLVHVVAADWIGAPMFTLDKVEAHLEEEKRFLQETRKAGPFEVRSRLEVAVGSNVARALRRVADEEGVSLVMMGARGKSLIEGILLGNVAKDMLRYDDTHLMVLRQEMLEGRDAADFCSRLFSRVLLPVDFSEPSSQVVTMVRKIESLKEAVLVHVVSGGETSEQIEKSVKKAEEMLSFLAKDLGRQGVKASYHVLRGNPAEEINSLARVEKATTIAMSSCGAGWLKHTLGSTTYEVVRQADRPVLVIRPRVEAVEHGE
ncbi:MAG: universal stress protein [Methanotrichaceae archaeon]|nr:universal stress protein [Methanotrichaceae archaeon]